MASDIASCHPDVMRDMVQALKAASEVQIPEPESEVNTHDPVEIQLCGHHGELINSSMAPITIDLPFGHEMRYAEETDNDQSQPHSVKPSPSRTTRLSPQRIELPRMSLTASLRSPRSYSFMEHSLSRRIHRRSLEVAYQIFVETHSDPQIVFRKFRLVKCMQDRMKMAPVFKELVRRPIDQPLELFGLPFYCIGGAGKHKFSNGNTRQAQLPQNLRLPKRILGLNTVSTSHILYEEQMAALGYSGTWYDSCEVEHYLLQKDIQAQSHTAAIRALSDERTSFDLDRFVDCECIDISSQSSLQPKIASAELT